MDSLSANVNDPNFFAKLFGLSDFSSQQFLVAMRDEYLASCDLNAKKMFIQSMSKSLALKSEDFDWGVKVKFAGFVIKEFGAYYTDFVYEVLDYEILSSDGESNFAQFWLDKLVGILDSSDAQIDSAQSDFDCIMWVLNFNTDTYYIYNKSHAGPAAADECADFWMSSLETLDLKNKNFYLQQLNDLYRRFDKMKLFNGQIGQTFMSFVNVFLFACAYECMGDDLAQEYLLLDSEHVELKKEKRKLEARRNSETNPLSDAERERLVYLENELLDTNQRWGRLAGLRDMSAKLQKLFSDLVYADNDINIEKLRSDIDMVVVQSHRELVRPMVLGVEDLDPETEDVVVGALYVPAALGTVVTETVPDTVTVDDAEGEYGDDEADSHGERVTTGPEAVAAPAERGSILREGGDSTADMAKSLGGEFVAGSGREPSLGRREVWERLVCNGYFCGAAIGTPRMGMLQVRAIRTC